MNVKEIRLSLGMSQQELAEALQTADKRIDVPMISRFENGLCEPTAEVAALLEMFTIETGAEIEADPMVTLVQALVPFGRENAVSRSVLADRLGLTDRETRKLIERARRSGSIILNSGDGRGYWQSTDLDEIQRAYRQETSRAMAILTTRKTLRDYLKAAGRPV